MEALFIFIAKSSGLIVVFFTAYYFLLRKETFFNSNRWFLLTGLITSVVLPFLFYTKTIWVAPAPIPNLNFQPINQIAEKEDFVINWNYVILGVYAIGLLIFLIKFALDFYSLNAVLKGKKIQQQADFKFVDVNENIAPFSYFDYIVYNSSLYSAVELQNIIEHEKVHSDQNHTVDVLISRVFCMLFWFNPIIWLYKKAIAQNLEFIADSEAAKKISDKKAYQYTLLKVTTHENCVAITNHFYQSLIKKRIIMLNKNQSKKRNSWKYYTVIPALIAFVLLFQVEVIAREKQVEKTASSKEKIKAMDVYKISKTTTDQELTSITEKLKAFHNVDAVISDVKRNADNELTAIKVDLKNGDEQSKVIQIAGSKAIKDCSIVVTTEEDGSKKINLLANDTNSKVKIVESQTLKNSTRGTTNTDTNVKVNDNTNQVSNTTANVTADVTTNVITTGKTVVITTSNTSGKTNGATTLTMSTSTTPKTGNSVRLKEPKLIIIDGVKQPVDFSLDDLQAVDIKTMHVYTNSDAIAKYGEEGQNGVIEIETRK